MIYSTCVRGPAFQGMQSCNIEVANKFPTLMHVFHISLTNKKVMLQSMNHSHERLPMHYHKCFAY